MKEPALPQTEEEIKFVFDSLSWNYSLLCPMYVYLGPVYKSGKNKVTK